MQNREVSRGSRDARGGRLRLQCETSSLVSRQREAVLTANVTYRVAITGGKLVRYSIDNNRDVDIERSCGYVTIAP